MKLKKLAASVSITLGISLPGVTLANTATFDGQLSNPVSYTEDGITFTNPGSEHIHLGDLWTNAIGNYAGCCADPIDITFSGGTFTLMSLDILYDDGQPTKFIGSNAATYTVSSLGHIEFGSLFAGVTSVHWITTSQSMIDNVTVTTIPEPQFYAMLLAGIGLVSFMASRRKISAAF